ncbi:MAG: PcfJ domain-containing protein [Phocaeicola sp.]
MKPRNAREREIVKLSSKLPYLEKAKKWAKKSLFERTAFVCKNEAWCSCCGFTFDINSVFLLDSKIECPRCKEKIEEKKSTRKKSTEEKYMTVVTTAGGYQVYRHILCVKTSYKGGINRAYHGEDAHFFFCETVQEWIREDGKRTVMAVSRNLGGTGWLYSEKVSIKNEYPQYNYYDFYAINGYVYPQVKLLPILRKMGLSKSIIDVHSSKIARHLLQGSTDVELVIKTKQFDVLKYMYSSYSHTLKYKHAFNICNRNKYKIKDASMWFDYLDLLSYFNKDTHNAHYVCPKNLKEAHDDLMRKKQKQEAKLREIRTREEKIRAAIRRREQMREFYECKMPFFGLLITDGTITIRPLESITQFYKESKELHHCVFTNSYYTKKDVLILTACKRGKKLETIELNLNTMKIVQCRGKHNGITKEHDRIVDLVDCNINLIRERIA